MPRVCSASAANITTKEVSAEKSCMPATPESTTRSVVPPRLWLSSSTSPKETRAPRKAPVEIERAAAEAEDDHRDRAGGGPGGDAEDERVGQRIAQQRLHDHAADREPGPADGRQDGTRQPQLPDDPFT